MKNRVIFPAFVAALMTTVSVGPAFAVDDATVAKLIARIDALEKEVADLKAENKESTAVQKNEAQQAAQIYSAKPVSAGSTGEAKWAAALAPSAGDSAKNSGDKLSVKLDKSGLSVKNAENDTLMRIHGFIQADGRFFPSDDDNNANDSFELRHARLIVEGGAHGFFYNVTPDFGSAAVVLMDAFVGYKYKDAFGIQFGKMKPPIGIDQLQGTQDQRFTEYGLPVLLTPSRDAGGLAFGTFNDKYFETKLTWQLGVFNNTPDNVNDNIDKDDGKEVLARLIIDRDGIGAGVAGTFGNTEGSAGNSILPSFTTSGRQTFFAYSAGSFADGNTWRVDPQAYIYKGPVGAFADYIVSDERVRNGATEQDILNKAWGVQLEWVLTGEDATYKSVSPAHPFDPGAGHWGAWELDARYGHLDIDDDAFPILASRSVSASAATNWGIGLNGFLNDNARVLFAYEHTTFEDGKVGGADRETENALFGRAQYQF